MSVVTVDSEKCKRDGICVAECPLGILQMADEKSPPEATPDAEELCIDCGHCVAVCPHGALSQRKMTADACAAVRKDLNPSAESLFHLMQSRRSTRVYKDQPVEKASIENLIDIARYAPSGHNCQPVSWRVVYDTAEVRRLSGLVIEWMEKLLKENTEFAKSLHMDRAVDKWHQGNDTICRGAPHLIIAHSPGFDIRGPVACTIALTWMELAAAAMGIGTCWAGYFNAAAAMYDPMKAALDLPDGHVANGTLMLGYSKMKYHRIPLRNPARITWK